MKTDKDWHEWLKETTEKPRQNAQGYAADVCSSRWTLAPFVFRAVRPEECLEALNRKRTVTVFPNPEDKHNLLRAMAGMKAGLSKLSADVEAYNFTTGENLDNPDLVFAKVEELKACFVESYAFLKFLHDEPWPRPSAEAIAFDIGRIALLARGLFDCPFAPENLAIEIGRFIESSNGGGRPGRRKRTEFWSQVKGDLTIEIPEATDLSIHALRILGNQTRAANAVRPLTLPRSRGRVSPESLAYIGDEALALLDAMRSERPNEAVTSFHRRLVGLGATVSKSFVVGRYGIGPRVD